LPASCLVELLRSRAESIGLDWRFGAYSVLVCVALTDIRFATRRDIEADLLTVGKLMYPYPYIEEGLVCSILTNKLAYHLGTKEVACGFCGFGWWLPSDHYDLGSANPERSLNCSWDDCLGRLAIGISVCSSNPALPQSLLDWVADILGACRFRIRRNATFLG